MFPASAYVDKEKRANPANVKLYWLNKLLPTPRFLGIEELADMLEEKGWFERDFQVAFGELEKEGIAKNVDVTGTGKRHTNFIHFDERSGKGERLIKVGHEYEDLH